jgi:hypothetical protein
MIVSPIPHLALDFQMSVFSVGTQSGSATGIGLAPMVQISGEPGRSTPYMAFGWIHASASLQNLHASVDGIAANLGYEWRWPSGFGILLGGGFAMLGNASATNGARTVSIEGGAHFNLELGFRFMFM